MGPLAYFELLPHLILSRLHYYFWLPLWITVMYFKDNMQELNLEAAAVVNSGFVLGCCVFSFCLSVILVRENDYLC
jgi:hypothetical protein